MRRYYSPNRRKVPPVALYVAPALLVIASAVAPTGQGQRAAGDAGRSVKRAGTVQRHRLSPVKVMVPLPEIGPEYVAVIPLTFICPLLVIPCVNGMDVAGLLMFMVAPALLVM